ncbi:hypothetical protein GPECTOR_54g216 [Gonium pectorale]|uniref:B30.2/SPRY domain-containing protein n=1 Tax=Gonium pectorale TaxID=33097 RepID=A0A150G7F4_GONPE|nr:hypothetical protein GPECTOR_54g216 [Gonium pectorale]|eukprot:KXZ45475.1 hypothetical protein GPECTOR_54g216 [Gonium pectorale]
MYKVLVDRRNERDYYQELDGIHIAAETAYRDYQSSRAYTNAKELLARTVEDKQAASVRADAPVPLDCPLYFFELTVQDIGDDGSIGIGFSAASISLSRLPGWDGDSYGYHGDDGNKFSANGRGTGYGPHYGAGDVVGALWDRIRRLIIFFRNGVSLGVAFADVPNSPALYPIVGLRTRGARVVLNLGSHTPGGRAFSVDLRPYDLQARQAVMVPLGAIPLGPDASSGSGGSRGRGREDGGGGGGEGLGGRPVAPPLHAPDYTSAALPSKRHACRLGPHVDPAAAAAPGSGVGVGRAGGDGMAEPAAARLLPGLVLGHLLRSGHAGTAEALAREARGAAGRPSERQLGRARTRRRIAEHMRAAALAAGAASQGAAAPAAAESAAAAAVPAGATDGGCPCAAAALVHWRLRLQVFLALVGSGAPHAALDFARRHLRAVPPAAGACTAWGLQREVAETLARNGEPPPPSLFDLGFSPVANAAAAAGGDGGVAGAAAGASGTAGVGELHRRRGLSLPGRQSARQLAPAGVDSGNGEDSDTCESGHGVQAAIGDLMEIDAEAVDVEPTTVRLAGPHEEADPSGGDGGMRDGRWQLSQPAGPSLGASPQAHGRWPKLPRGWSSPDAAAARAEAVAAAAALGAEQGAVVAACPGFGGTQAAGAGAALWGGQLGAAPSAGDMTVACGHPYQRDIGEIAVSMQRCHAVHQALLRGSASAPGGDSGISSSGGGGNVDAGVSEPCDDGAAATGGDSPSRPCCWRRRTAALPTSELQEGLLLLAHQDPWVGPAARLLLPSSRERLSEEMNEVLVRVEALREEEEEREKGEAEGQRCDGRAAVGAAASLSALERLYVQCHAVWDELRGSLDCPAAQAVDWREELMASPGAGGGV